MPESAEMTSSAEFRKVLKHPQKTVLADDILPYLGEKSLD
jgi:hypothetical protein